MRHTVDMRSDELGVHLVGVSSHKCLITLLCYSSGKPAGRANVVICQPPRHLRGEEEGHCTLNKRLKLVVGDPLDLVSRGHSRHGERDASLLLNCVESCCHVNGSKKRHVGGIANCRPHQNDNLWKSYPSLD